MNNKKSVKIVNEDLKYKEALSQLDVPEKKSVDQAWAELQAKLASGSQSHAETKVVSFRKWWLAAAAAVVVGVVLFSLPSNVQTVAQATGNGQMKEVVLPDGSTAWMNGSSTLEYASTWEGDRQVKMSGEVFFSVKKGSSFVVITDQGNVEVLGTSFDVVARNNAFRVECETGKVKVSLGNAQEILLPGDAVVKSANTLVKEKHTPNQPDWRVGKLVFEEATMAHVWQTIEWQFNINVKAPSANQRVFSGTLSAVDLNQALEQVCLAMNLSYEQIGNEVVIKNK